MTHPTYAKTLLVAAKLVGSKAILQQRLRVSEDMMDSWLLGTAVPPTHVFLDVVDILLDHNGY